LTATRAMVPCQIALALLAGASPVAGQSSWTATGHMAIVDYRVDAGFGSVERFDGWALGIDIARQLGPRLTVRLMGQGAQLRAERAGDLDRRIGDAELSARLTVADWWGFYSGLTLRAVANDAARQRWTLGRIGVAVEPAFSGGSMRAIGRLGVIPIAAVSGLPSASFAFDGAVGLDYDRAGVTLGVLYGLERFGFPSRNGIRRSEQVSSLTLRGGVRLR
jgi:hypothetical protein